MGLRDEIRASAVEQRVIGGVPWRLRPWDSWQWRFDTGGPAHPSRQFMGQDSALALPALYAGVKLLAENAASMPLRTYLTQYGRDGYPGKRLWTGPSVLDQPSEIMTQHDWVKTLMFSAVLQGNAWGWYTGRDNYGYPTGVELVPPHEVYVEEVEDEHTWNPLKAKVFMFGRQVKWYGPDAEVFHLRGVTVPGRVEGISPLRQFALLVLNGTEAMRFGTDWFASGGFPPGTFQNNEIEVDAGQAADMRARLVNSLRRHEPLVYGRDWDYKPVTVPPSEAQFLESIQMNATQIAAILNLPPDRIGGTRGDSLTYNSVEQSTLQIIDALRPWLVNMEQEFSRVLLPRNRMCKFFTDSLLKTDLQTRMTVYQIMRNIGLRTINELRDLEDLPPVPGDIGNETLPQQVMVAMGTRAGVIPKSFMKSVILEMDVATDRLIKLEKYIIPQLVAQGYPVQATPPPGSGSGAFGQEPPQDATGNANGTSGTNAGKYGTNGSGFGTSPGGTSYGQSQNQAQVTVGGRTGTPIGKPNVPLPLAQDPASFLASLISVQRSNDVPYEVRLAAQDFLKAVAERADNIRKTEPDEYVPESDLLAPFVPGRDDVRDMVLSANGKGRGHL